jgi:hypothetical protein
MNNKNMNNNSATDENQVYKSNEKEPILPWDELLFELDPLDEISKQSIVNKHFHFFFLELYVMS